MPVIIKDKAITDSTWDRQSGEDIDLKRGHSLLPLHYWQHHRDEIEGRSDIGIWLDADEEVEQIAEVAHQFQVIALNFPAFSDGRSLSSATILRRQYHFAGELRAIGDVRRDQLEQMHRCGFNAFQLAEGQDIEKSLYALIGFTYHYQQSIDTPIPLFRIRS